MFPLCKGRRRGCGRERWRGQGAVGGHGDGEARSVRFAMREMSLAWNALRAAEVVASGRSPSPTFPVPRGGGFALQFWKQDAELVDCYR
jgi:hypothetical protein